MKIIDKRPELFEKTESNIWTDSYIQQQMLSAHLDPTSDGASRKPETIQKIAEFISRHSKQNANLLDLGCGPGLYTTLFRNKGYGVTGIDFNKVSIEYAIKQHKDIQYVTGDYIKEYPNGNYDTVIMIYCDMGTHSDTDRDTLLTNIYNSLNNGGIFIFDIFTEDLSGERHESQSWNYAPAGGFWSDKEYLLLSQTFHYPENKAFASQYNLLAENDNKHFIVWDRYYSEEEIREVLTKTGFAKVSIHKNIAGENNFTSNNEMFIVAEK